MCAQVKRRSTSEGEHVGLSVAAVSGPDLRAGFERNSGMWGPHAPGDRRHNQQTVLTLHNFGNSALGSVHLDPNSSLTIYQLYDFKQMNESLLRTSVSSFVNGENNAYLTGQWRGWNEITSVKCLLVLDLWAVPNKWELFPVAMFWFLIRQRRE